MWIPWLRRKSFPRRQGRRYRPNLESLETRSVPTVSPGTNFIGMDFNDSGGANPPDTMAAVGPSQIIEVVNATATIYDKANGNVLSQISLETFFSAQGAAPPQAIFDPLVMYDEGAGRFVIAVLGQSDASQLSFCYFAVSNTSTPSNLAADFTDRVQMNIEQNLGGSDHWGDYPKLGINADAYVLTFNMFTYGAGASFNSVQVVAIDKSTVLDLNPATFTSFSSNRPSNFFTMAGANMHTTTAGGPMWFASSEPSGSTINITQMTNVLSSTPTYVDTVLTVPAYSQINPLTDTPPVTQQGGGLTDLLDLGDTRMLGSATRTVGGINRLVAAHHINDGAPINPLARARWYEVNLTAGTPTLIQSGDIAPSNLHTYFPSIDIASNGDIGMSYMESGPSEFVSMYVTARAFADPLGTMQTPLLIQGGVATLKSNSFPDPSPYRVGDYSSVSIDPSNTTTFWAANEYATSAPPSGTVNWGTWISAFSLINTDLAITKADSPDPVIVGSTLTYTINVVNNGPNNAPNTTVVDNLPASVNILNVTTSQGSFVIAGSTVTFTLGTLNIGNSVAITIQVRPTVVGVITNTVTVTSSIGELNPGDNTAQTTTNVINQFADMAIVKSAAPNPVDAGAQLTYILSVVNNGPQDALNVSVVDVIPSGLGFVSVVTNVGTASFSGGSVTASLGTMANGATATITITVNALSGGPKSNTATVSTTVTDPNLANNTSTAVTTVIPNAILVTGAGFGAGPDVRVYDNRTMGLIASFMAFDAGFFGGVQVAAGDVTGDGYPEVIAGAGPGGGPHVKVFDVRTGVELASFFAFDPGFQGGVNVAAGDVNGDNTDDVIVSAKQGPPHVKVFLNNGTEYYSFYAYDPGFQSGVWVGSGDIDGDGRADIITGPGAGGPPHVRALSGANLSVLANYMAYNPSFHGGVFVAGGDINGDGFAEIITGPGVGAPPHITIFDYFAQTIVSSFLSGPGGFLFFQDTVPLLGGARVAAGDVNGDGYADIFTATGPGQPPRVRIFSPTTQQEIATFLAYDAGFLGGVFIGLGQ